MSSLRLRKLRLGLHIVVKHLELPPLTERKNCCPKLKNCLQAENLKTQYIRKEVELLNINLKTEEPMVELKMLENFKSEKKE